MSIVIKGMDMPKSGEKIIILTSSGYVEDVSGQVIHGVEAVEVKAPHGRLIDAGELSVDLCCYSDYDGGSTEYGYSYEMLDNAPTIIEAEEKDDV